MISQEGHIHISCLTIMFFDGQYLREQDGIKLIYHIIFT